MRFRKTYIQKMNLMQKILLKICDFGLKLNQSLKKLNINKIAIVVMKEKKFD